MKQERSLDRNLNKLGTALSTLKPEHWQVWSDSSANSAAEGLALICSHIHAVKGKEYDAVLLSLEKARGGTALWDFVRNDKSNEALRVLYVGASRATDLLALGCTAREVSSLTGLLDDHQLEYELMKEPKK